MKKQKQITIVISVFIALAMIILISKAVIGDRTLKENGVLKIVEVYKTSTTYRGNLVLEYRFTVNKIEWVGKGFYPNIQTSKQQRFLNKTFPVIYLKENPQSNELLVTKEDFTKFNISYPDSLKWIEQYVSKY